MNFKSYILFVTVLLLLPFSKTYAHCEVPCGIYGDEMRMEMIREHVQTVEKAMKSIEELSQNEDPQSANQLIRWITTKEDHANQIQEIITQYFMTQRVKLDEEDKEKMEKNSMLLRDLHMMLVYAMKMKQTLDFDVIEKFNEAMQQFEMHYFGEKSHKHNPDGSHK